MTRKNVIKEGERVFPDDYRIIQKGALEPYKHIISVMDSWGRNVIGDATDFERDDEGNISFDIKIWDEFAYPELNLADFDANVFAFQIEAHKEGDDLIITKGKIGSIYLSGKPALPKIKE